MRPSPAVFSSLFVWTTDENQEPGLTSACSVLALAGSIDLGQYAGSRRPSLAQAKRLSDVDELGDTCTSSNPGVSDLTVDALALVRIR
jgi:hypothetical protein